MIQIKVILLTSTTAFRLINLTQLTFCFRVGEAVSGQSEKAGLEIFNTKLLPSLGSLGHKAEKLIVNFKCNTSKEPVGQFGSSFPHYHHLFSAASIMH